MTHHVPTSIGQTMIALAALAVVRVMECFSKFNQPAPGKVGGYHD